MVGTVAYGGRAEAEAAVAAARSALPAWRDAAPAERAAVLVPRRRAHARRDDRALGAHDARGRQDPPRGRRRRRRGDRLPRVLRARDAAPGQAQAHGARARRAQRVLLPAARRRAGDRSLELPAGDPHRHDQRGARRRQPGHHQAGRTDSPLIAAQLVAASRGCRRAGRAPSTTCPVPAARSATSSCVTRASTSSPSPARWRSACASSARRRRTPPARRRQARHRRDGRQERHHRRRRRRPRRGRARGDRLRLPLPRAEVLGRLTGDRARERPTRSSCAGCIEATREPHRRAAGGPGTSRRTGHHRRRAQRRSRRTSNRGGREARLGGRRRAARGGWPAAATSSRPHVFVDVPPGRRDRPGRDLRPRRGGHAGRDLDEALAIANGVALRAHGRPLSAAAPRRSSARAASSASATSTSTAASPARSSNGSPSAASR